MPFCARDITPSEISRRRDGTAFETLAETSNFTLANTIKNLSTLCLQTESIFSTLQSDANEITSRINSVHSRLAIISNRVSNLNPRADNYLKDQSEKITAARCGAPHAQSQLGQSTFGHRITSKRPRNDIWRSYSSVDKNLIKKRPAHINQFVEHEPIQENEESESLAGDLALAAAIGSTNDQLKKYNQSPLPVKKIFPKSASFDTNSVNSGSTGLDTLHRKHRIASCRTENNFQAAERNGDFIKHGTLHPKFNKHNIEVETEQIEILPDAPRKNTNQISSSSLSGLQPSGNSRVRLGRTPAYQSFRSRPSEKFMHIPEPTTPEITTPVLAKKETTFNYRVYVLKCVCIHVPHPTIEDELKEQDFDLCIKT